MASVPAMLRALPAPKLAADDVARGLGWFSLALGLAELLAARRVARLFGVPARHAWMIRACGAREIVAGAGILASPPRRREPWLWARLAGDAIDLAALVAALPGNAKKWNVAVALGNVGMVTWLDYSTARDLRLRNRRLKAPVRDYSARSGFPRPPAQMRGLAAPAFGKSGFPGAARARQPAAP